VRKRILVAVVCVPVLIVALLFLPETATAAVVGIISVISAYEMAAAAHPENVAERNYALCAGAVSASIAVIILIYRFGGTFIASPGLPEYIGLGLIAAYVLCFSALFVRSTAIAFREGGKSEQKGIMYAFMGGVIIPLCLSAIIALRVRSDGRFYVILPFVVAFITDAGAYFTGLLFGKHKAFPRVSPKKTVEGCVGGLVIGVAATLAFGVILKYAYLRDVSFLSLSICGLVGGVVTELGDFVFSLIKRERGIKDFGNLLPGHGGMLDRFDSMVLAAPAVYIIITVFPVFI
jgi:phosphatidate cytidylyltransferase